MDDSVVVQVSDHGPGIPQGQLEHIFDRFYRCHSCTERSGLGLAIAHTLTEGQEGAITLKSGEGQGSILELSFPAVNRAPGPAASAKTV
ncbi:MAG: sensor histidine kinase [Anaerolineae bacterium]